MGLIKIFSGKENIANNLKLALENVNIVVEKRQNKQISGSNIIFELFIEEDDFMKARDVIEDFKMNM